METVKIYTEYITLQELLKYAGAVETGGEAKIAIKDGEAKVNGEPCLQRGRKLRPGDTASFRGREFHISRQGNCRSMPPD